MVLNVDKMAKDLESYVEHTAFSELKAKAVPKVIDMIMGSYDDNLNTAVIPKESKANPEDYRELFYDRLENFVFLEVTSGNITFNVPSNDTFDFSGRLNILKSIIEGTTGIYVEVAGEDYQAVFGKKPISQDPLDSSLPIKDRVYLLRYNSFIKTKEQELKKQFVKYPFSNTPPIDIFSKANDYVENNLTSWINEIIEEAQKKFTVVYKG